MDVLSIVLQVVLGLGFLVFGFMKFTAQQMVDEFTRYGFPQWFRIVTGIIEVLGAFLLLIGIWDRSFALLGALIVSATMIGAILTHIRIKDPLPKSGMAFFLLILGVIVALLNKGSF